VLHLLIGLDPDADAVALPSRQRLHHERSPELVQRRDRFSRRSHNLAFGHRNARAAQQRLCVFLVLHQFDCRRARAIRHRGLNETPVLSITQLHEAFVALASPRDVSSFRRFDNCARARPELSVRRDLFCFPDLFADGERFRIENGSDETYRNVQQVARRLLCLVLDRHVVNARLTRMSSLAVIRAGLG
jgi:hypothetical protein